MRVFGHATDSPGLWTAPFPEARFGVKMRLMGGDLLSPDIGSGKLRPGRDKRNFFSVIPGTVKRAVYEKPCKPFLSVRLGRFGFYVGHKVFGVDSEAYLDYPLVFHDDVYSGSQALSGFTGRVSTRIGIPR